MGREASPWAAFFFSQSIKSKEKGGSGQSYSCTFAFARKKVSTHQRCRQRSEDIQQPVLSTGHVASPRCTTPLQGLILLILASAPDPCRSSIRSRRCERGRLKRAQPAAEPARDFTAVPATPRRAAAMAGERLRAAMRGEG